MAQEGTTREPTPTGANAGSPAQNPTAGPPTARFGAGSLAAAWNSGWVPHATRTAIAAGVSLACARLLRMPEAYWAPISALVVMQSSLGAAWDVSKKRFLGTALGAAVGGLLATIFAPRVLTFAAAIFALGLVCALLRLDHTAYRFAGITLAIVMLVARATTPWLIATHRFVEVSLGIVIALALSAVWPEKEPGSAASQ